MEKKEALNSVRNYINGIACLLREPEYVGDLDGETVFYCPRINKGKHLGWPIYYSVSENGEVTRLYPPKLIEAMKLKI